MTEPVEAEKAEYCFRDEPVEDVEPVSPELAEPLKPEPLEYSQPMPVRAVTWKYSGVAGVKTPPVAEEAAVTEEGTPMEPELFNRIPNSSPRNRADSVSMTANCMASS